MARKISNNELQNLYVVQTWDIGEVNGTELADAFIMCGVFYGLMSSTERDTYIGFAYDLYRYQHISAQAMLRAKNLENWKKKVIRDLIRMTILNPFLVITVSAVRSLPALLVSLGISRSRIGIETAEDCLTGSGE